MKIVAIALAAAVLFASALALDVSAQPNAPEWRDFPHFTPGPQEPDAPPEPEVPAEPDVTPGPGVPDWVIEWMEGWRSIPWRTGVPPWRADPGNNDELEE